MSKKIKLSDIRPDSKNFNKHTDEGMELLEHSVSEVGVLESIAIDAEGEVVSGNARKEVFDKLGLKPKFVELADDEYPVIKTDLAGEKRVKAAILANTVAQKNINLDEKLIQEVAVNEFQIDIQEIGVEVIDAETQPFTPNTSPMTHATTVTDDDITNAQQKIENGFKIGDSKEIDCICPDCAYEFKIKP